MPTSADFFDTNVLLYTVSSDSSKADVAEAAIKEGGVISVQVLNEVASVARRKMQLPWERTQALVSMFRSVFDVVPLTIAIHDLGLEVAARYALSVYDGQIVAAALEADCTTLWSADMQDGLLIYERLRVCNPFR